MSVSSHTDLTMVEKVMMMVVKPGTEGAKAQKKAATVKPLTDDEKETLKKACKSWLEMVTMMQSTTCLKFVSNHPSDVHGAFLALNKKFGPKTIVDHGNLQQRTNLYRPCPDSHV